MNAKNDKYVFLDRDGVLNKDPLGRTEYGYVSRPEEFCFIDGVLDAMKIFGSQGYKAIVISNQQGVGKGFFTEGDLEKITVKMTGLIEDAGCIVGGVYYCVHLKEAGCECRKPKKGLFLKAMNDLEIEKMEQYFYIGDTERDIIAGKKAGLRTILVLTGKSNRKSPDSWKNKPDFICENLIEAAEIIISEEHGR